MTSAVASGAAAAPLAEDSGPTFSGTGLSGSFSLGAAAAASVWFSRRAQIVVVARGVEAARLLLVQRAEALAAGHRYSGRPADAGPSPMLNARLSHRADNARCIAAELVVVNTFFIQDGKNYHHFTGRVQAREDAPPTSTSHCEPAPRTPHFPPTHTPDARVNVRPGQGSAGFSSVRFSKLALTKRVVTGDENCTAAFNMRSLGERLNLLRKVSYIVLPIGLIPEPLDTR